MNELKKHKAEFMKSQKNIPKEQKQEYLPPKASTDNVHPNAGYVDFLDSRVVMFYMNDLKSTPSKDLLR